MQIKHCLILAAGLGTRMGEIGKLLPKPLWPFLGITLLDLQINYAEQLGVETIYINSHYLHDQIEAHILKNHPDKKIILLYEPTLLDVGGAIHNLYVNTTERSPLLILNGDLFYYFSDTYLKKAFELIQKSSAVLFGISVNLSEGYNETVCVGEKLIEIKKPITQTHITYSGVSLVNLNQINYIPGPTKFFTSVANFETGIVNMITPEIHEYWDFGTLNRYHESSFKLLDILRKNKETFIAHLIPNLSLDEFLKNENISYAHNNFSIDGSKNIVLKCKDDVQYSCDNSVIYNEIVLTINS